MIAHNVMTERERESVREFRAFVEAEEKAEREKREAPIRAAQKELESTATQLGKLTREMIDTDKDPDGAYISPEVAGPQNAMTFEAARVYNGEQAKAFSDQNSWFFPSEANKAALIGYLERNDIVIVTAEMFRRAAERLRDLGLLEERPEPQSEVEQQPQQSEPHTIEKKPEPATYEGVDPVTGSPRNYSQREVNRMSADEYRRAFRLYAERKPQFIDARW